MCLNEVLGFFRSQELLLHYTCELNLYRVTAVAKAFESVATSTEKWYGTKYHIEDIPEKLIDMWSNVNLNPSMTLPLINEFIPTDFSIYPVSSKHSSVPLPVKVRYAFLLVDLVALFEVLKEKRFHWLTSILEKKNLSLFRWKNSRDILNACLLKSKSLKCEARKHQIVLHVFKLRLLLIEYLLTHRIIELTYTQKNDLNPMGSFILINQCNSRSMERSAVTNIYLYVTTLSFVRPKRVKILCFNWIKQSI